MLLEAIDFEMNTHDKTGYHLFFCGYRLINCCKEITINSVKYKFLYKSLKLKLW